MVSINNSPRIKEVEEKYGQNLKTLFYNWHWEKNLRHREIGKIIRVPRPTITRWFKQFKIPTQSCTRFTNLNLWSFRPHERPKAEPKIKREFPWTFNKEFFNKWTPEMAYVLGFLFADGYVFKNPRGSCFFCFCSTDREIIEKIKKVIGSNHTIGIKKKDLQNKHWKRLNTLQIGSKNVVKYLKKFGIVQNKSLIIKFPKVPKEFLGDFIRGYFDGDGSVNLGKYWPKDRRKFKWEFSARFTSGSKAFLLGLLSSLKNFVSGGYLNRKNGGYDLVFSRHDSVALFN